MSESRTAVVLAAGFGSRLEGVSAETELKPLTPVAGRPLLFRTIDGLAAAGCGEIIVVLGHGAGEIEKAIQDEYGSGRVHVETVVNPRFDLSNGISLLTAADHLTGSFILSMADHVFGQETFELAARHIPPDGGATLLVDHRIEEVFDLDDATKVLERDALIVDIGKQIDDFNCIDTGLFVCTRGLIDALQTVYEERGDASLSDGVAQLASLNRMATLDIGNGFWQDVDTPEMLAEVERRLGGRDESKPEDSYLTITKS